MGGYKRDFAVFFYWKLFLNRAESSATTKVGIILMEVQILKVSDCIYFFMYESLFDFI